MSQYVVVAKFHRQEQNGESRIDGDKLYHSFLEEAVFTFGTDEPISAIFQRLSNAGVEPVELRLFEDGSPVRGTDVSEGVDY